jgi:hypothetical protein
MCRTIAFPFSHRGRGQHTGSFDTAYSNYFVMKRFDLQQFAAAAVNDCWVKKEVLPKVCLHSDLNHDPTNVVAC